MEQTSRMPREEGTLTKTRTLTKMALCVALLAISAYISFPLPFTPAMVTALTIVVNLVAFILKPHEAFLVLLAWMILGAVGVPVFVGGTAGLGKLVGPTGGFVVSFLVAGWLMSKLRGNANSFKRFVFLGIVVGMPVIYIGGCIHVPGGAHERLGDPGGGRVPLHRRRCRESADCRLPGHAHQQAGQGLTDCGMPTPVPLQKGPGFL